MKGREIFFTDSNRKKTKKNSQKNNFVPSLVCSLWCLCSFFLFLSIPRFSSYIYFVELGFLSLKLTFLKQILENLFLMSLLNQNSCKKINKRRLMFFLLVFFEFLIFSFSLVFLVFPFSLFFLPFPAFSSFFFHFSLFFISFSFVCFFFRFF